MRAPLLANKIDGDCFALVRAHQHGITIHNQDVMTERESGVILFITYYYGGEGEGELGNSKISIVYSIRIGGGGEELRYHCAPSSRGQSKNNDRLPPSE